MDMHLDCSPQWYDASSTDFGVGSCVLQGGHFQESWEENCCYRDGPCPMIKLPYTLIEAKPAHKIQNFRSKNEDVQVLNSSAIASGYAGRDPQGGFCDRSVYVLY